MLHLHVNVFLYPFSFLLLSVWLPRKWERDDLLHKNVIGISVVANIDHLVSMVNVCLLPSIPEPAHINYRFSFVSNIREESCHLGEQQLPPTQHSLSGMPRSRRSWMNWGEKRVSTRRTLVHTLPRKQYFFPKKVPQLLHIAINSVHGPVSISWRMWFNFCTSSPCRFYFTPDDLFHNSMSYISLGYFMHSIVHRFLLNFYWSI